MDLTKYKHIEYCLKPNKTKIPINHFTFEQVDEFNSIYQYVKNHYMLVKYTKSHGISINHRERLFERYFVIEGNQSFELVVVCYDGCYRFLIKNKKPKDNTIEGQRACRSVYKYADKYGIDMSKYMSEDGIQDKKEIIGYHIKVIDTAEMLVRKVLHNVYHMDFNSSYASRICEAYPELKPMYEDIYSHRKENNGYYKHVLTNSIGCWQSEYCVDYYSRHKSKPFQFAKLSKVAVNGTYAKVEEMIAKLRRKGMIPILTNTDGIWYGSFTGPYHDKDEGNGLGQWKTDHSNCDFLMTSSGAYQYVEDGVCHSVVRGICSLDANEPNRENWKFGDILMIKEIKTYRFDKDKGVYKG